MKYYEFKEEKVNTDINDKFILGLKKEHTNTYFYYYDNKLEITNVIFVKEIKKLCDLCKKIHELIEMEKESVFNIEKLISKCSDDNKEIKESLHELKKTFENNVKKGIQKFNNFIRNLDDHKNIILTHENEELKTLYNEVKSLKI